MGPPSSSAPPSPSSEQSKLFIGGISSETREDALRQHFCKYGQVTEVVVMRDGSTGNGRGFAFVQFLDPAAAEKALDDKEKDKHVIHGRTVDVKRAIPRNGRNPIHHFTQHQSPHQSPHHGQGPSRSNSSSNYTNGNHFKMKKIFVGGLPGNVAESEFRSYFEKFGVITDAVVMYDNTTQRSRGFGFISFDSEEAIDKVMETNFHELNGKTVEVKLAVPKDGNNRSNHRNDGSHRSSISGGRGKAFGSYQGLMQVPYGPKYGYFHGFVPSAMSPYSYVGSSYGAGYPVGNYGGMSNGNFFVTPRGLWSGLGVVARQSAMPYRSIPMYPSYVTGGGGGLGSYMGVVGSPDAQSVSGMPVSHVEAVKLDVQ